MSLDQSLKTSSKMTRHRNVLTRAEKIAQLREKNAFDPQQDDPLNLPKVANRKVIAGGKSKKKDEEEEE